MENASKALIIAGAILLSILIIGIGMTVFNMARRASEGANLDAQVIETFNAGFTQFQGEAIRGSAVEALIGRVIAINADDDDETPEITFEFTATGGAAVGAVEARPRASSTYDVKLTYDSADDSLTKGMVNKIEVKQK